MSPSALEAGRRGGNNLPVCLTNCFEIKWSSEVMLGGDSGLKVTFSQGKKHYEGS